MKIQQQDTQKIKLNLSSPMGAACFAASSETRVQFAFKTEQIDL